MLEYIKYRWNAKGRHGTHSPFVYDLVDKCFQLEVDSEFIRERNLLFQKLKKNRETITIEDFGAGSKYLSNQRRIQQIFNTSSSKGKYGDLLFRLSKHYKPHNVLEFGTSLGIGTINLFKGNPTAKIVTVEACRATRKEAIKNFESVSYAQIESICSTFQDFLQNYKGERFDIVFIDGHHNGEALINYLKQLQPITHNDTIFILDDIRWSNSMFTAWQSIISSQDYHVTIDLFRMGIILKRPQQEKEHFIVKL